MDNYNEINEINEINDIEEEGNINPIPSSFHISSKFLLDNNKAFGFYRQKSLTLNKYDISKNLSNKDFKIKLNNTAKIDKFRYNMKLEDGNSYTTKSSINYKIKKVTFSTVEIIRVTNYKNYNKLNSTKRVDLNNSWFNNKNCLIF